MNVQDVIYWTTSNKSIYESLGQTADESANVYTAREWYSSTDDAETRFDEVQAAVSESSDWSVKHYRSPDGGVTVDEVREWYIENTDKDEIPTSWNPDDHIVTIEESQ